MKTRKKFVNRQNSDKFNGFTSRLLQQRRIGSYNKTATVYRQINGRQYDQDSTTIAAAEFNKFNKVFVENFFSFNVTLARNVKLRQRSCYRKRRRRQNTQNNYVYAVVNAT